MSVAHGVLLKLYEFPFHLPNELKPKLFLTALTKNAAAISAENQGFNTIVKKRSEFLTFQSQQPEDNSSSFGF
jgi:hypothetical protein